MTRPFASPSTRSGLSNMAKNNKGLTIVAGAIGLIIAIWIVAKVIGLIFSGISLVASLVFSPVFLIVGGIAFFVVMRRRSNRRRI